jgi:phosphoenolpyruvate-protein kinase (PTS system EI component)
MRLTGRAVAAGFATGPAWIYGASPSTGPGPTDPETVVAVAVAQLEELAAQFADAGRADDATRYAAQAAAAGDDTLLATWQKRIASGQPVDHALVAAAADLASAEPASGAIRLLLRIIRGEDLAAPAQPSIVVALELPEGADSTLPPGLILGIAVERGEATAGAAAMAARLGVPCVVAVDGLLEAVRREAAATGEAEPIIAVDGVAGLVFNEPTDDDLTRMRELRNQAIQATAAALRDQPARTKDGKRVGLTAIVATPDAVIAALAAGTDGLLIPMAVLAAPAEDALVAALRAVLGAGVGPDRPVIVRLPGDAARLRERLRAISRAASAEGIEPGVLAPHVATQEDVIAFKEALRDAQASLAADGLPGAPRIAVGIEVSVPSAAFLTRELAPLADFFAIDVDGLTDAVFAATMPGRHDGLHPAAVRAIRMVTGAAGAAGKPVSAFGTIAVEPAGALVLIGLGVDELITDASAFDGIRYHLAVLPADKVERLGAAALDAENVAAVRELADDLVAYRPPLRSPIPY